MVREGFYDWLKGLRAEGGSPEAKSWKPVRF